MSPAAGRRALLGVALAIAVSVGCDTRETRQEDAGVPASPSASVGRRPRPLVLYLPDGGDIAPDPRPPLAPLPSRLDATRRCPPEMVDIAGRFCIDRYEASLVDRDTGRVLSPYYPPDVALSRSLFQRYRPLAHQQGHSSELEVPPLEQWQLTASFEPMARSAASVVPSAYLSALVARRTCEAAGKRLCQPQEWTQACRGERDTRFPYGDQYVHGTCNVFRESHPAAWLHGNASVHHLDPRLNLVAPEGRLLLAATGAHPGCRSVWGDDAVYDMVGNLDEWVEDEEGSFHGGFYARSTRQGCAARIASHAPSYFDYSLGTRCCL